MRKHVCHCLHGQRGMTLLEVLVTLGVLSMFMVGTLQFYTTSYRHLNASEASLELTHDAHKIMSMLAEDIRQTEAFVPDFPSNTTRIVLAAMRMAPKTAANAKDVVIVYSLDADRTEHLFRTVSKDGRESSLELSSSVQSLSIHADDNRPVRVELTLQKTVAGQVKTFEASSAYAVRF
ncbi:MAG: prepilin-type N-terminal cleavage/methylation domain-containing protein [bacterium]|nr:prepilin-type N-terminal cleavage/methylation domain-containing protein [bacterium]